MDKINLENKILREIDNKNIKPISKINFLLKEYSLYLCIFTALVATTISFGASFFILDKIDFENGFYVAPNFWRFAAHFFPFFWVSVSVVSLVGVKYFWDQTKRGYKWSGKSVVTLAILMSAILGILLHVFMEAGRGVDNMAGRVVPFYKNFEKGNLEDWLKRGEGRMFGKVSSLNSASFTLLEKDGTSTEIFLGDFTFGKILLSTDTLLRVVVFEENNKLFACALIPEEPVANSKRIFQNRKKEEFQVFVRNEKCESLRPEKRILQQN